MISRSHSRQVALLHAPHLLLLTDAHSIRLHAAVSHLLASIRRHVAAARLLGPTPGAAGASASASASSARGSHLDALAILIERFTRVLAAAAAGVDAGDALGVSEHSDPTAEIHAEIAVGPRGGGELTPQRGAARTRTLQLLRSVRAHEPLVDIVSSLGSFGPRNSPNSPRLAPEEARVVGLACRALRDFADGMRAHALTPPHHGGHAPHDASDCRSMISRACTQDRTPTKRSSRRRSPL